MPVCDNSQINVHRGLSFASNLFSLWASLVAQRVSSYSTWFLTMV